MHVAARKYLARYAEPEAALAENVAEAYEHVLVVPAYRERSDLLARSERAIAGASGGGRGASGSVLVVVVLNRPPDDELANQDLARSLEGARDVVVLERVVARREGVGLARKIGCDFALALRTEGKLTSAWVHTTDADATLPESYFRVREPDATTAALARPFVHVASGDALVDAATAEYDAFLRYWVRGLEWAGSPFAFHTVGSTLSIAFDAYAKVRGFPKRSAGEDFHMMAKLAEVGEVLRGEGDPIEIEARVSNRVPFGTGPRVVEIAERSARAEPFLVYDPRCFAVLRDWLSSLDEVRRLREVAPARAAAKALVPTLSVRWPPLERAVRECNADTLGRRVREWFGALRTLQLVRAVRESRFPDVPLAQALARAPF